MNRRSLFAALGGTVATWALPVRGQQRGKLPTIGFLGASSAAVQSKWTAAFVQRLGELGWIEGRTVAIEFRWAEGKEDSGPEVIAEFVRRKVDVIVTHSTSLVGAAMKATSTIPIVFAAVGEPVRTGFVASLARPGGNVTGLSLQQTDVIGKRLQLLREMIPHLRRLAVLGQVNNVLFIEEVADIRRLAGTLGLKVVVPEIRRAEEIAPAMDTLKGSVDAIYLSTSPIINTNCVLINTRALGIGLPTSYGVSEFLEGGGLMSYGPDFADLFRRSGDYVDKILRGVKPADIPVEQPTKWDFVINLTTAKALGLSIPQSLLAQADEVIE